jgi:hypothetical protein
MSVLKMVKIGRPKIAGGKKKITFPHSIDPQLLKLIRKRAKHGKVAAWMNAVLWEAVNK